DVVLCWSLAKAAGRGTCLHHGCAGRQRIGAALREFSYCVEHLAAAFLQVTRCLGRRAVYFFFPRRRRHTRSLRDWSSDVCSSDLVRVPRIDTSLSTRRVLVSEYVEGERFEAVRRADEVQRDRYGEIVFRLYFGLLYRDRIALGDPHPGNFLLCPDGRVCFLDFGLVRRVDANRLAAERAIALAVREEDPTALKGALLAGGYLPADRAEAVDADFALNLMRMAI